MVQNQRLGVLCFVCACAASGAFTLVPSAAVSRHAGGINSAASQMQFGRRQTCATRRYIKYWLINVPDIFSPFRLLTSGHCAVVLRRGLYMVATTRGESRLSREYKVR
jgi:hypothetical protein